MSEAASEPLSRRGGIWAGLMTTRRVLNANFLRESRARFGEGRFAYFRALAAHVATIGIFFLLRHFLGAHPAIPVDLFTSLVVGFFPYLLFITCMKSAASSLDSNKALLYYPGVRPLDFVFAFVTLEGVTIVAAFVAMLTINYQFVPMPRLHDPLETLMALVAAWLLGSGVGLCFMSLYVLFPILKTASSFLFRPLLFVSGVMYAATELPAFLIEILWWNPVFHTTEMAREGVAASYKSPLYEPWYVAYWILGSWAAGLVLERYVRRNIRS